MYISLLMHQSSFNNNRLVNSLIQLFVRIPKMLLPRTVTILGSPQ